MAVVGDIFWAGPIAFRNVIWSRRTEIVAQSMSRMKSIATNIVYSGGTQQSTRRCEGTILSLMHLFISLSWHRRASNMQDAEANVWEL